MGETKVFQPKYFKKFKCTCDKCRYNCCRHNWQIRIDKSTYDKYTRLDSETGKEFLDKIKVISQDPFIAIIITNSDGSCHFLDDKGFCSIQLKLGYDYLSRTCRIHPRSISYISGEFETFLELSCEEAVKAVLFEHEPMMFEQAVLEPDGDGKVIPNRMLTAEKYTSAGDGVLIFGKLRMTSTAIMQSRQYSVRFRMLLLCLLVEQAGNLLKTGEYSEILRYNEQFLGMLGTGVYDSLTEQIPDGVNIDYDIVLDILSDMESKNDERFNTCLKQALDGLGLEPDSSGNYILPESFQNKYKEAYQKYFADREYVFENYIVNHILMEGFPFNYGKESGVMANFADLLARFNLIEFLLVGVNAKHGDFDEWNIINCVSAFSRCYDHALKGYLLME
jgi:lysine-N-methylase